MTSKREIWILLRGLGREKGHWGSFPARLEEVLPGAAVVPVDLPGTGEYRLESSPWTVAEILPLVRDRAMERAAPASRVRLIAISLGAMVAVEWLKRSPRDLEGAVLINTSMRGLSPATMRLRWQVWPRIARLLTRQTAARDRERDLVEMLINSEERRAEALVEWTNLATARPVPVTNTLRQLTAGALYEFQPFECRLPVLILSGLGDRFVDPSCSQVLHERTGWPIERHPWGGHDLTWDDPAWVANAISKWRASLEPTASRDL